MKLPKPRNIEVERYVGGLSELKNIDNPMDHPASRPGHRRNNPYGQPAKSLLKHAFPVRSILPEVQEERGEEQKGGGERVKMYTRKEE